MSSQQTADHLLWQQRQGGRGMTVDDLARVLELLLAIKAKFESVESGIAVFDEEFLAQIVVPGTGGETVGERMAPQIAAAYTRGVHMPPLLPSGAA